MPGMMASQKHRGLRNGRQHNGQQSWWNDQARAKIVKEKMYCQGSPPREDLDVSNEMALRQFWEINESGLRQLGVRVAEQIDCEVVKDAKGARFTFTLPITTMPTSTRHQLATSFKKAFYKHRKVLIIINHRETSVSQSPQRDLELLSNIGIETVSVVYNSPSRSPPPSRVPTEDHEVFQYLPAEVRDAVTTVIQACDVDADEVCRRLTLEIVHQMLALTPEQAVSSIRNTEPLIPEPSLERYVTCQDTMDLSGHD
eukprot:TRINITY_DN15634_c0_g1_i2.p1 TRINITY_DN15634_c0_g1~~TRINITY_DN15634_c0_g1_i2.p1  ORF type:complete len:256 (+),score=73.47 TRINITY_DN15634_c0_g1_i2:75-842(+)